MIQQTKTWTCLLACLALLAGCGGGGDGASNAGATGGLSFQLQFVERSDQAPLLLSNAEADNICTAYEIDDIQATLSRMDGTELASETWPCEDHGGILDGVAPTTNLVLVIEGFVDDEVAWRGQKAGIEILPGEITQAGTVQMINITEDQAAPQILSTTPQDGATEVPINAVILVRFDEPVSAVSLNDAFLLTDNNSNSVGGEPGYEDNDDEQLWRAKFEPAGNLRPQTQYTITLLTVVHDLAGNNISEVVEWRFTTGSEPLDPLIWGTGKWGDAWQ